VNIQHDCVQFSCKATGTKKIIQDHVETVRTKHIVAHAKWNHYILNTTSLHNYQQLQKFLPLDYPLPESFVEAREEIHKAASASLRYKKQQAKDEKEVQERWRVLAVDSMELDRTAMQAGPSAASILTAPHGTVSYPFGKRTKPKEISECNGSVVRTVCNPVVR